jgi:hypothetical protein
VESFRHVPFRSVRRVPSSTIAHVSVSPPLIPDGRLSRVRLAAAAYPQRTFPTIPKLKRSLVYTPSMIGYTSSSTPSEVVTDTWLSVQTVFPVWRPPLTESPFTCGRCYPPSGRPLESPQRALPLLHRSYGLMRQTTPLPPSSVSLRQWVCAGCRKSLLGHGPSRRCLRESFPRCLDPYPGGSSGANARYFPEDIGLRHVGTGSALHSNPYSDFRTGDLTGLQSFAHVQASGFARHPGRSHRSTLWHWAAVACTSERITVCYLPVHRIC